jgi:hypothetical protein
MSDQSEPAADTVDEQPQYSARVVKLYRALFGRDPDPGGLDVNVAALKQGRTFEELFDAFVESPEYRERDALIWQRFRTEGDVLPWSLKRSNAEGACLIVTFPGLGLDRPTRRDYREHPLDALEVHRLDIGSDTDLLLGPGGHVGGAKLATEVVVEQAAVLGVPRERVICVGPSFHGSCALYVGFAACVGSIIVGAPGVRLGSILDSVRGNGSGEPELVRRLERQAGVHAGDWEAQKEVLDGLIMEAALACPHPVSVEVFASERDIFYDDSAWLVMQLAMRSRHKATLTRADYPHHGVLDEPFHGFLVERLRALLSAQNQD